MELMSSRLVLSLSGTPHPHVSNEAAELDSFSNSFQTSYHITSYHIIYHISSHYMYIIESREFRTLALDTGQTHSTVQMSFKGCLPLMHSALSVRWVWGQTAFPSESPRGRGRASQLSPWNSLCFLHSWRTNPQTRKWLCKKERQKGSLMSLLFAFLHKIWHWLRSQRKERTPISALTPVLQYIV